MLSTAQPEINRTELNKRITRLDHDYQNAKKILIDLFTGQVWRKASGLNKADRQAIEKIKKEIPELIKEANSIQAQLVLHGIYDNFFFLTKLKIKVLNSRYAVQTNDLHSAFEEFGSILKFLATLQKRKGFDCTHDIQFQQEAGFVLSMFDMFMHRADRINTPEYFDFTELSYALTKKWPSTINKLLSLTRYWFCPKPDGFLRINGIEKNDRIELTDTYEGTVKDLKAELISKPTDAALSIHLAMANTLAYQFEHVLHPHSIFKQRITRGEMASITYEDEDLRKYLKFVMRSFAKYLATSAIQLLKANPAHLRENGEPASELIVVIQELRSEAEKLLLIFENIERDKLPEDIKHDLVLAEMDLLDFVGDTHQIAYYFNLHTSIPLAEYGGHTSLTPAILPAFHQQVKEYREEYLENEKKKYAAQVLAADNAATFLMKLDEQEKQSFEKITTHLQNPAKKKIKKQANNPNKVDNTLHFFTRAQYYARNRRSHDAVEMYELAYDEAMKSNDLYPRLAAMDGQLFVHGRTLSHKAKMARSTLATFIKRFDIAPDYQLDEFTTLMQEVTDELQGLCKLHFLYSALTHHPSIDTNLQISEGITTSKLLLAKLIDDIKLSINQTNDLFAQLDEKFKRRTHKIKHSLGLAATKHLNKYIHLLSLEKIAQIKAQHTFSDAEVNEIGEEIYINIGKEKRRQGLELSAFTHEKNRLQTLGNKFKKSNANFLKMATEYQHEVKELETATSVTPFFAAVSDVPGKKLLVGSASSALKNAHDLDFVMGQKDEQAVIKAGFHHAIHLPNLYQRFKPKLTDIAIIKDTSPAGLIADAKKRDYTICAIYTDENNKKHDPLGTGINDLANRRLRMIGDPVVRLAEDPVRALRGIRFMVDGYHPHPVEDLNYINALKSLANPKPEHLGHLKAVAKKHLTYIDRKQYVTLLQEFGLLDKLFGIKCKSNINLALWRLERLLELPQPKPTKHSVFFAKTDDNINFQTKRIEFGENPATMSV